MHLRWSSKSQAKGVIQTSQLFPPTTTDTVAPAAVTDLAAKIARGFVMSPGTADALDSEYERTARLLTEVLAARAALAISK